jgi:hypothetical protein
MSINVYWACLEDEWLRANKPVPLSKLFYDKKLYINKDVNNGINGCPAVNDDMHNVFGLESIYDYEFTMTNEGVVSPYNDQLFANRHLVVRSKENKFFTFRQDLIFFTDEPSLLMTSNMFPYLEDNSVTERCMIPQGTFDIGRWFRNTDFTFYLKNNYDTFKISFGDIYSYVKFHTTEKINFIEYRHDEKMSSYLQDVIRARNYFPRARSLEEYYFMLKIKKLILLDIKKRIL